jgi:phage tail-like protein
MTRLADYAPRHWRARALEYALLVALGASLDTWRTLIATRHRYVDPAAAPVDWLDWLMRVASLPRQDGLTERRKRNLVAIAHTLWPMKGTREGIELYVRALVGVEATARSIVTTPFIAGVALAGDALGGAYPWRYEVVIPPGSIDVDELRDLLVPVVPAYMEYRIVDTDDVVLSDFA